MPGRRRAASGDRGHKGHVHAVFRLDPAFHATSRRAVQEMVEHGGNVAFGDHGDASPPDSPSTSTLHPGDTTTGGYNFIKMPRGLIDWHSHPNRCRDADTCAVGLPSPADLKNIAIGAVFGTQGHLVYSDEGTYLVQLHPETLSKLREDPCNMELFACAVDKICVYLHHDHIRNKKQSYTGYQRKWFPVVRALGFNVRLFPGDAPPEIPLCLGTAQTKAERAKLLDIAIPTKEQRDAEAAHCKRCPNTNINEAQFVARALRRRRQSLVRSSQDSDRDLGGVGGLDSTFLAAKWH